MFLNGPYKYSGLDKFHTSVCIFNGTVMTKLEWDIHSVYCKTVYILTTGALQRQAPAGLWKISDLQKVTNAIIKQHRHDHICCTFGRFIIKESVDSLRQGALTQTQHLKWGDAVVSTVFLVQILAGVILFGVYVWPIPSWTEFPLGLPASSHSANHFRLFGASGCEVNKVLKVYSIKFYMNVCM